ncbi:MAG: hypothetical protein ACI4OA_00620 [Selenomonadaceae bacterium]
MQSADAAGIRLRTGQRIFGVCRLLTEACREKCAAIFEDVVRTPYFGNGRFVRNLFEQATLRQAKRLMETGAKIEKEQGTLLLPEDFETLAIQPSTEKRIGFC